MAEEDEEFWSRKERLEQFFKDLVATNDYANEQFAKKRLDKAEKRIRDIVQQATTIPFITEAIMTDRENFLKNGEGSVKMSALLTKAPNQHGLRMFLALTILYTHLALICELQKRPIEQYAHLDEAKKLYAGLFDPEAPIKYPKQYLEESFRQALLHYSYIMDNIIGDLKNKNDQDGMMRLSRWGVIKTAINQNDKNKEKFCTSKSNKEFYEYMTKNGSAPVKLSQNAVDNILTRSGIKQGQLGLVGPDLVRKSELSKCHTCGKQETCNGEFKRCSRCKKPYYCGKECQMKHWKEGHREECKA